MTGSGRNGRMKRGLLCCGGIVLGLAAVTILWNGPGLYLFANSWQYPGIVGVGVIVEGALLALGAALCLGRALIPLSPAPTQSNHAGPGSAEAAAGGGPVLPICGILFLLAAAGPFGQARFDSQLLQVMESIPDKGGGDLVEANRRRERTERTISVLWLIVGGALLGTPLFLKARVWQLGWRISGVGCGIALGGLLLSVLGVSVWYAGGFFRKGGVEEVSLGGQLAVLAGAIVATVGAIIAVRGKGRP
jgi:hypothetical protein